MIIPTLNPTVTHVNHSETSSSSTEILPVKILELIKNLGEKSVFPTLNRLRLIDLVSQGEKKLIEFIYNNSILSHIEDIFLILQSKYSYIIDNNLSDPKLLDVYEAIFSEDSKFDKKIAVFSGGTGSNSLVRGLQNIGANLSILLNAYDDGKSTGDIRKKFNVLGPSDIAKNLIALLEESENNLREFLSYRFPKEGNLDSLKNILKEAILNKINESNPFLYFLNKLEDPLKISIRNFISTFYNEMEFWEKRTGNIYDLRDYGIRNIIYAGAYFYYKKNHLYTINKLRELMGLKGKIFLNNQENLWLIALTKDGVLLNSESAIANDYLDKEILEIFLVRRVLNTEEIARLYSISSVKDRARYLRKFFNIYPESTNEIKESIIQSDIILFAPTTFYSSLAPTLITKGISKSVNQSSALKISVSNLIKERGYSTAGENLVKLKKYLNREIINNSTEIDYIIINIHGNRTDGIVNANRIPIDKKRIYESGTELIEIKVEDYNKSGKHQGNLVAKIIYSLKKIEDLGYKIHNGRLTKKENLKIIEIKKDRLRQILRNPFLYKEKSKEVDNLITDILGVNKLEDFCPIRPIKVIILAAGNSNRFNSDIPKVLYPILGKANLAHLLDKYSLIDKKPLVVVNSNNECKVKEWAILHPQYPLKIVTAKGGGTATTLFDVMQRELNDFEGDVFLSWGDITNIRIETILRVSALHQSLGSSVLTVPTSLEKNPYAGLTRDKEGNVNGTFMTKEHPEQKQEFGEHDSSIFVLKSKEFLGILEQLINNFKINGENIQELNFLETIPLLVSNKKEVVGVACVNILECTGFNTLEEAKTVERYMREIGEKTISKGMKNLKEEHSHRLNKYLQKSYKALIFDVDGTFINSNGNPPKDLVKKLIEIIKKGIPLGIITGRTNDSLCRKFIDKITSHPTFSEDLKEKIYVYPENGAYCYNLNKGINNLLYNEKIPYYIEETAVKFLRENILGFRDDYSVTPYKIHIWPRGSEDFQRLVQKINHLFKKMNLPLIAYKSSLDEKSASLLISLSGVNKGLALSHFSEITNIPVNEIVKIADMADFGSTDYSMLEGEGSFSVSEIDSYNNWQAGLVLAKGQDYKEVLGSRWLLDNLRFSS